MTPTIKIPKIKLFGDVLLLQPFTHESPIILLNDASTAIKEWRVASIGDGERSKKLAIGDRVELLNPQGKFKKFDDQDYLLVGFDNIVGVIPE